MRTSRSPSPRDAVAENPWRRDEVVHLLHAWRHVTIDRGSATAADDELQNALALNYPAMFAKFQEFNGGATQRTLKSLVKTRKSLDRSFRFISMFNQNHVVAKSMSETWGGHNWFAVPLDEQRRVVNAHYKKKPFAYIDQEIFDAIELIMESKKLPLSTSTTAEESAAQASSSSSTTASDGTPLGKRKRTTTKKSSTKNADALEEKFSSRQAKGRKAKTAAAAATRAAAMANKLTTTWSREDILVLLRAWTDVLSMARPDDEPSLELDKRISDRYLLLAGKMKARSLIAMRIKRYSILQSYQFIMNFNANKISRLHGEKLVSKPSNWYALSRKERTLILQKHYNKSHYAHLDEDMLPLVAKIKKLEAKTSTSSASSSSANRRHAALSSEPWTVNEDTYLALAWRDAVASSRPSVDYDTVPDSRIFDKFAASCKSKASRRVNDVTMRKQILKNTYEFIRAFQDEETSGSGIKQDGSLSWFKTPVPEREKLIAKAKLPCAEMTEIAYAVLDEVIQKMSQDGTNQDEESSLEIHQPRTVTGWFRGEVQLLLRAWTESLESSAGVVESAVSLNSRTYDRFLELCGGTTTRSVKGVQAKRESILHAYQFVRDFNAGKISSTGDLADLVPGTKNDWCSLSVEGKRNVVRANYKNCSFSYLDSEQLGMVERILQMTSAVDKDRPLAIPDVKPEETARILLPGLRANSWMPEELRNLLCAWHDVVFESPQQPDELVTIFNARIYKRFEELCGGEPKKAEASFFTKRKTMTNTYKLIVDYNRQHSSDQATEGIPKKSPWFSMSVAERKKKIKGMNKKRHSFSYIDEEIFNEMAAIFELAESKDQNTTSSQGSEVSTPVTAEGEQTCFSVEESELVESDGDTNLPSPEHSEAQLDIGDSIALSDIPDTTSVGRSNEEEDCSPTPVDSSTEEAAGNDQASSLNKETELVESNEAAKVSSPQHISARTDTGESISLPDIVDTSPAKSTREANSPEQPSLADERSIEEESDAETISDHSFDGTSFPSSPEPVRKKQRLTPDLSAVASFLEKQSQHLTTFFVQVREERQREQEQRRLILKQLQQDQEEREHDREERKREREQTQREWERFSRDRQAEREKDRALLEQLLQTGKRRESGSNEKDSGTDSEVDDDDRGSCAQLLMMLHS
ncbi:hypothetical protein FI667_g17335, partial [Globisporangium splendens]